MAVPLTSERTLENTGVKDLGGGNQNWFSNNFDWFHWGPVGLTSAEVLYMASQLESGTQISLAVLQTNLAFSRRLRHSWLILQYNPRVLYVDGHFGHALSNQDSTLDLLFAPTSRLTVGISDSFSYYGANNLLNDRTLGVNQFSGAISNPFLDNGSNTLVNALGIPVSYKTSAHTSFTISPFLDYVDTFPASSQSSSATSTLDESEFSYGVRTQLNHMFSPRQSAGVFYQHQVNQTTHLSAETHFDSFGMSASRGWGKSFAATVQLGASYSNDQIGGNWTGVGGITLSESFRRGSLQGNFSRNANFTGILGTQYSNQAWASYGHQLGRKTDLSAGGGYLARSDQGSSTGKYVNGRIDYRFRPNISWFFAYARYTQSGSSPQLVVGDQSQFQVGLRWSPNRKPRL